MKLYLILRTTCHTCNSVKLILLSEKPSKEYIENLPYNGYCGNTKVLEIEENGDWVETEYD